MQGNIDSAFMAIEWRLPIGYSGSSKAAVVLVVIPIQGLAVVYRQAEHRRGHRFCFYGYCMATPISYYSKVAQVVAA